MCCTTKENIANVSGVAMTSCGIKGRFLFKLTELGEILVIPEKASIN